MSDLNLPPLSTESWMTDEHGHKIPLYHGDDVEERERILLARIAELEADAARYRWLKDRLILDDIIDCSCYEDCESQEAVEAAIDTFMRGDA